MKKLHLFANPNKLSIENLAAVLTTSNLANVTSFCGFNYHFHFSDVHSEWPSCWKVKIFKHSFNCAWWTQPKSILKCSNYPKSFIVLILCWQLNNKCIILTHYNSFMARNSNAGTLGFSRVAVTLRKQNSMHLTWVLTIKILWVAGPIKRLRIDYIAGTVTGSILMDPEKLSLKVSLVMMDLSLN